MRERIDIIDCLRGLAIAMVVLVHCGQAVTGLSSGLQQFAEYGGRGVELFFALSAFTLFTIYHGREFQADAFYIRRFFRIAPMFYIAMIFYTLYASVTPHLRDIVVTASFLHGFSIEAINRVVPGGWSIADEMIFYLIFPWLLRAIHTPKRAVIELTASIVLSRASFVLLPGLFGDRFDATDITQFAAFNFLTQAPAFFIGITAYFMVQWCRAHPTHSVVKNARIICCASALGLLICAVSGLPALRNYLLADVLLLPFLIGALLAQPKLLLNTLLRHLGRVSYSVYLIHFLVVAVLTPLVARLAMVPSLSLTVLYIISLGISYYVATLTWRVIEEPMIALGHRIAARRYRTVLA